MLNSMSTEIIVLKKSPTKDRPHHQCPFGQVSISPCHTHYCPSNNKKRNYQKGKGKNGEILMSWLHGLCHIFFTKQWPIGFCECPLFHYTNYLTNGLHSAASLGASASIKVQGKLWRGSSSIALFCFSDQKAWAARDAIECRGNIVNLINLKTFKFTWGGGGECFKLFFPVFHWQLKTFL